MRKSRFNEQHIIGILKESEAGMPTAELCRKHGIASQTLYRWKGKYGGMEVSEAKRLRALEEENRVVEAHGGRTASGQARVAGGGYKKMVSPQLRRQAVVVMRSEVAVSERRACGLIQIYRRTYRYAPRPEDPRLRVRLRELAAERRRFGYRRLTRMLVREGWKANHKRVYRLYVEEKLSLRRKRGRRRRAGSRLVLPPRPTQPDHLWTMDFASDAFTSGRSSGLNLMDGFTREALELPDTSLPGARVVRVLEGLSSRDANRR